MNFIKGPLENARFDCVLVEGAAKYTVAIEDRLGNIAPFQRQYSNGSSFRSSTSSNKYRVISFSALDVFIFFNIV
jgi:hypothetical protein